jgi:hypothetical protein
MPAESIRNVVDAMEAVRYKEPITVIMALCWNVLVVKRKDQLTFNHRRMADQQGEGMYAFMWFMNMFTAMINVGVLEETDRNANAANIICNYLTERFYIEEAPEEV